jgi:D-methionine transport system substrate-binding protein
MENAPQPRTHAGPYRCWLVAVLARARDSERPDVKALVEAYHSANVRAFVQRTFRGAVVPAW